MADSSIVITAGLQIPQSVNTITKDLKQVSDQLNAAHALKITANIDLGKSTQRIQAQLATIGKDLKLSVASINAQSIQQSVAEATKNQKISIEPELQVNKTTFKKQVDDLFKELDLEKIYGQTGPAKQKLQGLLSEYTKAFQAENYDGAKKSLNEIIDLTIQFEKEATNVDQALKNQQDTIRALVKEATLYVTKGELRELAYMVDNEANARNMLNSLFFTPGVGQRWTDNPMYKQGKRDWADFAQELNGYFNATWNNTLNDVDAGKFSEHFAEGITKLREYLSQEFNIIEEREEDAVLKTEAFAERLKAALAKVTGLDPGRIEMFGWETLFSDQEVAHVEENAQTVQNSINNVGQSIQNLSSNAGVNMNLQINTDAINQFTQQLANLGVQGVNIDEVRNRFQNLGITINQIVPTFKQLEENGANVLSSVVIKGRDATNQLVEVTQKFNTEIDKNTKQATSTFDNTTTRIVQDFERVRVAEEKIKKETDTLQKAYNKYLELLGKANVYMKQFSGEESLKASFQELVGLLANFRQTDPIEKQQEAIIRLDNALKLIKVDIDEISKSRGQSVATTQKQLDAMAAKQLHLLQQYQKLEAQITKAGTTMSAVAIREDNGVRTDYSAIFNNIINGTIRSTEELKKAQDALTTIRNEFQLLNAQTGSTLPQNAIENFVTNASKLHNRFETLKLDYDQIKNKSSDLSESFSKLSIDIKQFENFNKATIGSKDDLTKQVQAYTEVKRLLDEVRTSTASALKEQRKQESEYKNLTNSLNDYINALQTFNNSSIVKKNSSNADVVSQMATNENLIAHLQAFSQSLKDDSSPENLKWVKQFLDTLIPTIEKATQDSAALNQQLKNTGADNTASANLEKLKNQMISFSNANLKAVNSTKLMRDGVTTFAQGWQDLLARLNSGTLDAAGIQKLTQDFRVFTGEVQAAGLATTRIFANMGNQLRMLLTRYVSLYAVIGYIKKMVTSVKELDTAMINVRRVTDETSESYEKFLANANKMARELHTTTSSLVEQTYQWAKLGYDLQQSLDLARSSTIFAKVADIDENTAVTEMVATMKAFNIEAEKSIDIVDKLDILNNKFAVSASGLGQGLERSASALAATGNSLEQTLAMLTGAGEITQNLENTGNALKVMSLRLQNMRGKLEELNEPVDDLMEVSKVQTKILNLTHNQVDIFDKETKAFRSTYDIIEDISEIWDTLSSTSRASLTEVLFGSLRSNQGLALIQAFQTGQVQEAYKKASDAAGTATKEYQKMMEGIQSQMDALKGSFEEFANAFMSSEFVKGVASFLKLLVNGLTLLTEKVGSLGVALAPLAMYISANAKMNIFSAIVSGIRGITANTVSLTGAATGASVAVTGLKTALTAIGSAGIALAIGLVISAFGKLVDKLIVTKKEAEETVNSITDSTVSLGEAIDELESDEAKLERITQNYAKAATTVANITERKQQLYEIQTELTDSFGKEAEGIDLVNGKYSEQIKRLDEIAEKERERVKRENAPEIAEAQRLARLNVEAPKEIKYASGDSLYTRDNDRKGDLALYTLEDLDAKAIKVGEHIQGVYKTLEGTFDAQGLYLSGTIEEARDQLGLIIDVYSQISDRDESTFKYLSERYTKLNAIVENINKYNEYFEESIATNATGVFANMFQDVSNAINDAVSDAVFQPFYDKLDEAQEKLEKLATGNLSIDEFTALTTETRALQEELYEMANGSEWAAQKVTDLFQAYQQGLSENGDSLQDFLERFESQLEGTFKDTAEIITSVQNGIEKLSEGKGLTNSEAWKLLKADSEGYLKTIKLVNGEYVFAQEELIKFKDAEIQKTVDVIKADNAEAQAAVNNLKAQNADREQTLFLMRQQIEANAILMGQQQAAKKYAEDSEKIRIQISETKTTIEDYEKAIARNNLLVEELVQNLGNAQNAADATLQSLNDTVDALEAESDAIDDAIDALNARKDILESEKDILQEQLDILKEQEKELKSQMDTFKKAVSDYSKRYEETLKSELDHIKDQKDEIKDQYDERIKALKRENEERDTAYKKEKAILDLNKAKEQQVRTYSSARGWEYGASKEKVLEAQKNLEDVLIEEQIQNLENERDDIVKSYEDQEKEQEKHLKAFQDYAKKYEEAAEIIENADGEILAEQILGANWRVKIENQDEGLLNNYKNAYQDFTNKLDDLSNRQIKAAEESVKAKQAEIDKIGDEIKAYNNYKNTVKSNLDEAKKAVESYKNEVTGYNETITNSVSDMAEKVTPAIGAVQSAFAGLETSMWENSNKICGWVANVIGAFNELQDTVGSGAVGAFGMGLSILGSHAKGGVADYTGLAMLHGSKSSPETIFNANDSKKLYDMIHNTPNIMASMMKQATQIAGFKTSNVSNNTANSINVNIGQVVANNPQELTRNLDTHLDSYFRRKLTQGYTQ